MKHRHPGWYLLDLVIAGIACFTLVFILAGIR